MSEHFLWTLCLDTSSGHFVWTLRLDTSSGHFLWTLWVWNMGMDSPSESRLNPSSSRDSGLQTRTSECSAWKGFSYRSTAAIASNKKSTNIIIKRHKLSNAISIQPIKANRYFFSRSIPAVFSVSFNNSVIMF